MANLVELSNQLEDFPEQQLVQMSQDPNSMYPSYLVLSEIQRRNQMRKMYEAQQPKPQTTVAEEVIGEFAGQQGLQGAMAQSPGPQDAFPPSDMGNMAPPSPMQAMASGGIVGYKNKGKTEYKEAADDYGKQLQEIFEKEGRYKKRYSDYEKGERLTYPLTPRDYVVSDEEYSRLKEGDYVMGEGALQEYRPFLMLLNALDGESGARYMPESEVKGLKAKLKASIMEDKLSQMGMASGGRTGYQVGGFTPTAENPYPTGSELVSDTFTPTETIPIESLSEEQRYEILEKSEGMSAADKLVLGLNAAALGLLVTPAPGARIASGATKLLSLGVRGSQGLKKMYDSARSARLLKAGQKESARLGGVPRTTPYNPEIIRETGRQALRRELPVKIAASSILGGSSVPVVSNLFDNNNTEQFIPDSETNINRPEQIDSTESSARKTVSDDVETGKRGLSNFLPNADPTALIGLGGAIMGANTIGELGKGISEVALGERARKDALSLNDLKNRLTEAQINKYEADIANMPLDIAIKQYQSLNDLVDSGVLTADEAKLREVALMERIQRLQGITVAEKSKRDELLGLVKEVG